MLLVAIAALVLVIRLLGSETITITRTITATARHGPAEYAGRAQRPPSSMQLSVLRRNVVSAATFKGGRRAQARRGKRQLPWQLMVVSATDRRSTSAQNQQCALLKTRASLRRCAVAREQGFAPIPLRYLEPVWQTVSELIIARTARNRSVTARQASAG
jgi:hypothetical protein